MILKMLNPLSVLDLFKLNNHVQIFENMRNQKLIWIQLIREHFPNSELTNTPKLQYKALATNVSTRYYAYWYSDESSYSISSFSLTKNIENNYQYIFELDIPGLPIIGKTRWVYGTMNYDITDYQYESYTTQYKAEQSAYSSCMDLIKQESEYALYNTPKEDLLSDTPRGRLIVWLTDNSNIYNNYNMFTSRLNNFDNFNDIPRVRYIDGGFCLFFVHKIILVE